MTYNIDELLESLDFKFKDEIRDMDRCQCSGIGTRLKVLKEMFDEMIAEMGADRRHVKRVKMLATIPGGEIYQYFSDADEKYESSGKSVSRI